MKATVELLVPFNHVRSLHSLVEALLTLTWKGPTLGSTTHAWTKSSSAHVCALLLESITLRQC